MGRKTTTKRVKKPLEIFIGLINHKYGTNVYVNRTHAGLNKELYEYVIDNWASMFEGDQLDRSESQENAIQLYFEEANRCIPDETLDVYVETLGE